LYAASLQAGGGSNKRLNAEDMAEYSRKYSFCTMGIWCYAWILIFFYNYSTYNHLSKIIRREEANKKTVNEKQQLENVRRQEKTCSESTHRLKEKMEDLDRRCKQLEEEKLAVSDQKEKVLLTIYYYYY